MKRNEVSVQDVQKSLKVEIEAARKKLELLQKGEQAQAPPEIILVEPETVTTRLWLLALLRLRNNVSFAEERSDSVKKSLEETKELLKWQERQISKWKEPLNERMQATELFIQSVCLLVHFPHRAQYFHMIIFMMELSTHTH